MKKLTAIILTLCVCISFFCVSPVSAEETEGIYQYVIKSGQATIIKADKKTASGNILIPEKLGGADVTTIGKGAFSQATKITSLTIPDSVTTIGNEAFSFCSGIETLTIGKGVTAINERAFNKCTALTKLTIPEGVTTIGTRAFEGCSLLEEVSIPKSTETIGSRAFSDCGSLKTIKVASGNKNFTTSDNMLFNKDKTTLLYCAGAKSGFCVTPENVEIIASYAFANCENLVEIELSKGVAKIGENAFLNCSNLEKISLPDSLMQIGDYAFNKCSALKKIQLPKNTETIGNSVFGWCAALEDIIVSPTNKNYTSAEGVLYNKDKSELICCPATKTGAFKIPDDVTKISDCAFFGCRDLSEIIIPNSVTQVGSQAFYSCENLTEITLPNSLTAISYGAFAKCSGLKKIEFPSNLKIIDTSAFTECKSLSELALPASLTQIGEWAFSDCDSLTNITIPNGLETIAEYAFTQSDNLKSVTIPAAVKSIGAKVFDKCENVAIIGEKGTTANKYANDNGIYFLNKDDIGITLDGKYVPCDQPPVIINDRTLVPMRAIFEALGAEVSWDSETRTASGVKDSKIVSVTIDTKKIVIDGVAKEIDVPAQIISDRTMLPVRAVAEAFGCVVDWNSETRTVVINK